MTRLRLAATQLLVGAMACALGACATPSDSSLASTNAASHTLDEIAPGVFFAQGTGQVVNTVSNAMIVVNENDVLVVDSHITPDAARELIRTVRTVTDKPIEFLVNSHFHYDHAHGNQAFPDGVQIIGHEYTRDRLIEVRDGVRTSASQASPEEQRQQAEALFARAAAADGEEAEALATRARVMMRHADAIEEVVPTPPNTTFDHHLTLHRGDREIQLIHLGRGHTGGDVVVFLPAERIIFTGDLLYSFAPYLGDAYVNEFPQTLERLKAFDWEIIVPGHGPLVRDPAIIDVAQAYLRDYWRQVEGFRAAGLSVEEALEQLDLSAHRPFGGRGEPGAATAREIARMYALMDSMQ